MKRLMMPLIAFVVFFGLGGTGGALLMRPGASADDSTHTDSTTADSSAHGSSATLTPHGLPGGPDSTALADDPHIADPGRDSTPPALGAPATPAATSGGAPNSASAADRRNPRAAGAITVDSLLRARSGATVTMRADGTIARRSAAPDSVPDYARMARLLSKMGPREAARTIEQLSGTLAARSLAAMSDKQAAQVLQQLSPAQAASLLQATLALLPKMPIP